MNGGELDRFCPTNSQKLMKSDVFLSSHTSLNREKLTTTKLKSKKKIPFTCHIFPDLKFTRTFFSKLRVKLPLFYAS